MNCFIIGNGGWGTALGMILNGNDHNVTLWGPFEKEIHEIRKTGKNTTYLPDVTLPKSIRWTSDPAEAEHAELVVLVVPSRFVRSTLEMFRPHLPESALIVSATKGLDEKTHKRMSEVAFEAIGREIAVLSGPSHAEEVARGVPTAITIAGKNIQTLHKIQETFNGQTFRVYTSDDVIGVELGGTLKNIIAVAAGILDGLKLGDNSKAALITRGLAEISRLGIALGANPATFSGLSGIGDLIVTCSSRHSRNRSVGERLGKGETLSEIMEGMKQVAEGVWNAKAARDLAREYDVDMPITTEVCAIVEEGKNPQQALHDLMNRDPGPEHPQSKA
jgi:glycerol-3-phosphate dehydrogenase (NAD(P)+)